VQLPSSPGYRDVQLIGSNTVASVKSIFTGQMQVQRWPGADFWHGTFSLPLLTQIQTDAWIAALLECQGMTNAFQLGDPMKKAPRGTPTGVPTVDGTFTMKAGSSTLYTYGWAANSINNLIAGDYLQVGYRLHRVLENVNADGNGKAAISIWPSLRETPSGLIVTNNAKGLFRLATNDVSWNVDFTRLTTISFQIQEYR
jgi:hypothetical protein